MDKINHIKARLLGLLVGGGKIDNNTFIIDLPYNKWGMDPTRMSIIAADILTTISNDFKISYGFNVSYSGAGRNKWLIIPVGNPDISALIKDLGFLQLPTGGFLLSTVDLTYAKTQLSGISIESFLSGIFDTRASLTLSHRRFNDDAPVVSVEIPGSTKNFKFVVQLCSWLTDLGSITDQILYNHPNQHSGSDPNYTGWKKGFKIRFLVKSFLAQHSFALQAKSIDITKIQNQQKRVEQPPCYLRKLKQVSSVSVHSQQNSDELPEEVRNRIFFHYHHFCAVLGCPHAPVAEIAKLVKQKNSLINFFPRLSKGPKDKLKGIITSIQLTSFPEKEIRSYKYIVKNIIENETFKSFSGLDQGIAYLFAPYLSGKRHTGSMTEILENSLENKIDILSIGNDFNSPLLIINPINDRAFICSSVGSKLNQRLINKHIKTTNLVVNLI